MSMMKRKPEKEMAQRKDQSINHNAISRQAGSTNDANGANACPLNRTQTTHGKATNDCP